MIIGTITLITILFFGGIQEYFLVDKLEKGVKTHIVDKERKKEILADVKESKAIIKAFNKESKSRMDQFKSLNISRTSSKEDFESLQTSLNEERENFQKEIIQDRLDLQQKFEAEEWTNIIAYSDQAVTSKQEKAAKKAKDPFEKLYATIDKQVTNTASKERVIKIVDEFANSYVELNGKIAAVNTTENKILIKQNATKDELQSIADGLNEIRSTAFATMVDFHYDMLEVTPEENWDKIMKEFNKLIR